MQEARHALKVEMAQANRLSQSIQKLRQMFKKLKDKEYPLFEQNNNKAAKREAEEETKEYLEQAENRTEEEFAVMLGLTDNKFNMLSKESQEVLRK